MPIAIGVFALITLTVLVVVVRYRGRPPEQAAPWREANRLEIGYAILLTCTAAFLLYLTFAAEHRVDTVANRQRPAVEIDVISAKWEWQFAYPGYGFSVRSGTVGRQPFVVPAGRPVRFVLTSDDVIHAFWIPALRYKHDLFPMARQVTTLTFARPGTYPGQCAEFCGLRHVDMLFTAVAVPPARFEAWARNRGRAAA